MAERQCLIAAGYLRDGKLRIVHQDDFKTALSKWSNCRVLIRLEEHLDPLSAALRGYYFGTVVDMVSHETGLDERETHEMIKRLHTPLGMSAMRGTGRIEFPNVFDSSITTCSNSEMWAVIENVHRWAAEKLDGLVIPDPIKVGVVAA